MFGLIFLIPSGLKKLIALKIFLPGYNTAPNKKDDDLKNDRLLVFIIISAPFKR
jgi:hypothetical protein